MANSASIATPIYRVRVAVPVYLYDCFDYSLSQEQYQKAEVGARVAVSFGRQNLTGIIVEKIAPDAPLDSSFKLKAITELLDDRAILDEKVLNLLTWSAQYYQFPIGEVMQSALPTLLRQGKPYNLLARTWNLLDHHADDKIKRSERQQEDYKILKRMSWDGRDSSISVKEDLNNIILGYHMNMIPDDAAKGILLLNQYQYNFEDFKGFDNYPDISQINFFKH